MSSFYITLISDNSMELFPNNTQCCFRTKLSKPIMLDKQNWEMALTELIVPSQVKNIEPEETTFYIVTKNPSIGLTFADKNNSKETKLQCSIPEGIYATPNHLVEELDMAIKTSLGELLKPEGITNFGLDFSNVSKRVKFTGKGSKSKVGLRFHRNLLMKLGGKVVESDDPTKNDVYPNSANDKFEYGVDLNMGMNHLYIYSDLPEYTLLGDTEAPILRVVPFETRMKAGTNPHLHMEFLNLHYIPVSKSFFDEITVNIKGDTGKQIHFTHGKSMVKLHFRRKTK